MGVLPKSSAHQGPMWVCVAGLLFCALLVQVSADSQEESDLAFDSLDQTNLRNNRISRHLSSYSNSESSQPIKDEDHWLTRTVNRIKRSIGGIFSTEEKQSNTHHQTHKEHHEKTLPLHHQGKSLHEESFNGHHPNIIRKNRQSDYDEADEDDIINEDIESPEIGPGIDDEDAGYGSGKDGSGDVDEEVTRTFLPTDNRGIMHEPPRYYRFIMTVEEYYKEDFRDRDSNDFRELAGKIEQGTSELFSRRPGRQTATVISIEKDPSDDFKVRVTTDLESVGWYESEAIKNVIHDEIQDKRTIGSRVTVSPDNFIFRSFEGEPKCEETELTCNNKQCVDLLARCNGIRECSDNSDEEGCPATPRSYSPAHEETTTPSTTTSTSTASTPEPEIGSGEGEEPNRADDVFYCANGVGFYYGDQKCDGVKECEDGTDEQDCEGESKCAQGEYSCDVTRCIPLSGRCNGLFDCTDKTDEQECDSCTSEAFHCDNNKCIMKDKVCDDFEDCRDGSDERNCKGAQCLSTDFSCGDGQCIPGYLRCTGTPECSNGADERGCPGGRCQSSEFACDDGQCIPGYMTCNGYSDCRNGEDERNCPETTPIPYPYPPQPQPPQPAVCRPPQIQCRNGECVNGTRCDRIYDCIDGTDEENCQYEPIRCGADQFQCRSGSCINAQQRCDRIGDCKDGSDEEGCECPDDEIDCGDGTCVEIERRCDGRFDCRSGRDEEGCPTFETSTNRTQERSCVEGEFDCGDGQCIAQRFRCDGYSDCNSRADEQNCACQPHEHRCPDGSCISSNAVCNFVYDCSDGSDEANCTRTCPLNEFRCERDNKCIPNWQRCDRARQCSDGSDEEGCDCYSHEFRCGNGQCVDERLRCNGHPDCSDYTDEYNCRITTQPPVTLPPVTVAPRTCPPLSTSCSSGDQCILRTQLCDGRVDCRDMSDESNCGAGAEGLQLRTYPTEQEIKENRYRLDQEVVFQCRDEGLIRARVEWRRANGLPLPPGSRDINGRLEMPNIKVEHGGTYVCVAKDFPPGTPGAEVAVQLHVDKAPVVYIPPPVKCYVNESTCANGDCIARSRVCDGRFDCSDGSDEVRCATQCEPNEFKCDNKKCVYAVWKCDGQDDCGDGSDEQFCRAPGPGEKCGPQQFTCLNEQCVPKSFHCDGYPDCMDRSDEIGCTPPTIAENPPPMVSLNVGQTFTISCRAVGVPTPQIMWRLNWHHVPHKCRMTSVDGIGTLTCEDIQIEDQGAYSCEALSTIKTVFATDTILTVAGQSVCRPGYFNVEARSESECIKCFCFGQSTNCRSADLFVVQFQPPFDALKLLGARIDPYTGVVDIRDEPIYKNAEPHLQSIGRNGVRASLPYYAELNQPDVVPYFALPENYHGNQLKSYGGYLKYTVLHSNNGRPVAGPDVILTGNNYILLHESRTPPPPNQPTEQQVRFFEGDWIIKSNNQRQAPASREDIMMALEDVTQVLIKLEYNEGVLNTSLTNIEMDTAAVLDNGLGVANYVEECSCPVGYSGTSCESCADGYARHDSGPWLGQCYKETQSCAPGSYFDGRECQVCPCPYTSPSNQFARTCHLNTDGNVVCDCQPGYVGLRCEHCAPGYTGNPLQPGDVCRPVTSMCDAQGSRGQDADGRCLCKEYTTGPYCNQCKPNSFHLSTRNQFGCISCFCMGVTQQCTSSSWYRDTIQSVFTHSSNEFRLTDIHKEDAFSEGIRLNQESRELVYSAFGQTDVYYWSLPNKYLGDKVTSYGGYLRYTIRNIPVPGGASSRNNAPDVELVSENRINLQYFATNISQSFNGPQTVVVPLLEQYWQRNDGEKTDREHLLMTLADVKAIYIKATYFTNTQEAALVSVSMDTATDQNTGRERAYEVEQCHCPLGYTGLSCEDCAFGYTRSDDGIYLELCKPCECNGFSNECDPETGVCRNCRDNTAGDQCEQCQPGYSGDPTRGQPCRPHGPPLPCNCDPRGATYNGCVNGVCQCKANVEGPNCNRCRNGTFGLSRDNIDGCEFCFCSGVTTECSESQLYIEQIPVQIIEDHGFILTDQYFRERITQGFKTDLANNEIGYIFPPSRRERMYWSLPTIFTGNQIKSYGGKLEYMQRYIDLPDAKYIFDKDIIITGNNVVIYWMNSNELQPKILNSVSARIHPSANWYRLDQNREPKSASREDILTVLANIDTILIRATPSTDTASTFLSDISLDTAVEVYTAKPFATSVETCRCPPGYRGTSCESCASGYYKDFSYSNTNPLGTCRPCPCNNREENCQFDSTTHSVVCNCLPGYSGRSCENNADVIIPTIPPTSGPAPPVPPTIEVVITGHNIEIYQIGSSVRLNCSAVSRRVAPNSVRIGWSKANDVLPYNAIDDGRGILYIRNLTASDSGRYICRADDGYSVVTESVNLVVGGNGNGLVAPTISVSAPFVQASEGQLIEVRCLSTGNPLPEFFLSRIDRQPLNPAHSFDNGVFRIHQAKVTDSGQYLCSAINQAGQDTRSFEVQVLSSPVMRVEIEPSYFEGNSGDQVVLRCIADSAQNIRWSKDNGPLPYQYRDENGVLIIPNAQPSDTGRYICTATSYDGTKGTQSVNVDIRGGRGVHPTARISPDQLVLRQGDTTEVKCEVTGSPTPTVKWSKVNGVLGGSVEQIGNSLHFTNARVEDRAIYVCVASNDLGLDQASVRIDVTRFEPPLVQIVPNASISTSLGNSVQMQCRAIQGYPPPTITWGRENGRPLSPNVEVMTGGNLRIIDITPAEAGEYVCSATNEAGTAKASAYITVSSPPILSVSPEGEIITKAANEDLTLACYGTGVPQPSVYWYKALTDGRTPDQLSLDSRRVSAPGAPAYLEFRRLRPDDAGVYICMGQNEAGMEQKRVQVDILPERGDNPGGDQGSPSNVQEFIAIAGARAELRCRITTSENSPQIVDWIRPHNMSLPEGAISRHGTLYIDNVQPSAAGDYECVTYELPSRNVMYRMRSKLRVLSPPKISLEPIRQVVAPGQNAYIRCFATGDQPITIQWLPINRTMPASVYTSDGYIRFNNIHHSDAGKYRCVAKNNAGEADSVSEVFVSYQPDQSVSNDNHVVTSPMGSTVALRCRPGIGSEQYPVRWMRIGGPLPENSRIEGPILHFFDVQRENEGEYYCEIETPTGLAADYVTLKVAIPEADCPANLWRCDNDNCIYYDMVCNGVDDCRDNSDERQCEVIKGGLSGPVVKSLDEVPVLFITPEESEYPVGGTIDLKCQSSERGVIPNWSKLSGGLADNVQNRAGRLTIYNARSDNAGPYRCEATGEKGHYYKDYNINIKPAEDPLRDETPVQVQRAKRGSSVILYCDTDLEEPVKFTWSKQGGNLPFYVDETARSIQLNTVGAIDSGTYICSATNQRRILDIPIVLVVTDIIPYFTQAPNSYLALPTLPDAYMQFSFEISFKPESDYGLILYNGNREKERYGDFISLALNNGYPEFKFNLGPGTPTTVVRSNETVAEREWHTIKVVRNKKRVIMYVDGKGPFIGENEGKYFGLDLSEPLYLGGVPAYDNISSEVDIHRGLVGCISKFKIGYSFMDILHESLNSHGITNCETCTENKCHNQGTCQEALTTEGFTCICSTKFSGPTCNKRKGEACSPYSCGVGRCIDTEHSYKCQCPLGRGGRNCEKVISVYEPAFKDNAYIAYPPPRPLKRTKIEMKVKPRDVRDGILLYGAETNEGHGDFISLAIKDRHIEFRFDNGKGPVVVRSDQEIVPNKWTAILVIRSAQDGRILVDGHPSVPTRFSTFFKPLTLLTPLYVGGYDQHTIKLNQGVKVEDGFNGCIVDINVAGLDESMMKNSTDSSNVEDCASEDMENSIPGFHKTGCTDNPCKNNAPCIPLSPIDYQCTCSPAFTGKNCELPVDLCKNRPCKNEGICKYNSTGFTCDCPLRFTGKTCEQMVELRNDAHFEGNGWLEFSKSQLPHRYDNEPEIVALEFSTNKSDGLIFWHGQNPNEDGQGQDYISLALSNGYLEFSYDLGSGPAIIRNTQVRVDDGERHSVILKRQGRNGSIEIDHMYTEEGESEGRATSMNCNGNIYLGGTPNISRMTGSRFSSGFDGCIHGFELQQSKTLDLGLRAVNGLNVKPCSSFRDMDNNI